MIKDKSKNKDKLEFNVISAVQYIIDCNREGLISLRDSEKMPFEEIMDAIKHIKRTQWIKRIKLFLIAPFYMKSKKLKNTTAALKKLKRAYTYLLENKSSLEKQCLTYSYNCLMDEAITWSKPWYFSGDNVSCKILDGVVVTKSIISNSYEAVKYKNVKPKISSLVAKPNYMTVPQTEEFFKQTEAILERVAEEMNTGSYRGLAEFTKIFFSKVVDLVTNQTKEDYRKIEPEYQTIWLHKVRDKAKEVFRRIICTENSKSSSKPKDDDSQS